ncbi:MAG: M18 family aminopeptidase [Candidatus Fermentibacteraceae bacterium]|nr:M18 family aminopeptidase [Candidatus Fermentibacteraceae bacterium]
MNSEIKQLISFLQNSPTAAHCVEASVELLNKNGFRRIFMDEEWKLNSGEKCMVVDSDSTVAAFIVGKKPAADTGFRIIGTHTDAPGFRLKPEPYAYSEGLSTLGVEIYGGPTVATWFDRDLGLAGSVSCMENGCLTTKHYRINSPVLRFPSPAIHLNRNANKDGFKANAENQLLLVFGEDKDDYDSLKQMVAASAGISVEQIIDFSGEVFDVQPPALNGIKENFLVSAGIDNRSSTHAALAALIEAQEPDSTAVVFLFDNEEIGSKTVNGAASPFMERVLERVSGTREQFFRACSRSINVSADCVHAVHPGWADKHSKLSKPELNKGPAIKMSAGGSYASSARTSAYFLKCAELAESPVQKFVSRADAKSGGTLGPIAATGTGIPTVDVGNPMLSMHSCREMSGTVDHRNMINCMKVHLEGSIAIF